MTTTVYQNQPIDLRRRMYFHLVDVTDGMTPETGETGGQPQISTNGAAWTNTGVGTLVHIGNGRYYGQLTQAAVATIGDFIEGRYKSANTAECPGIPVQVEPVPESGFGSITFTYTLTSSLDASPIADADVWVTSDSAGTVLVTGTKKTDASGQVVFYLDAGTYFFWRQKAGWTFDNPDPEVVS